MTTHTVGVIELASLSKGFEVSDAVLKSARVEKLLGRTVCSGKYLILVRGSYADVESSLATARDTGGFAVVAALAVPNVEEAVFSALAGAAEHDPRDTDGLLVVETFSAASAIKAGDMAVKEAGVALLRIHAAMAIGGKGLVVCTGDVESLKSALAPVLDFLKDEGMLAGYALLPHPHPDVLRELL